MQHEVGAEPLALVGAAGEDETEEYELTCSCGWTKRPVSKNMIPNVIDRHRRLNRIVKSD